MVASGFCAAHHNPQAAAARSMFAMKNQTASSIGWRYSTPAIVLHWVLAVLIVFMAALGWWMMTVEHEPGGERWIALHKSVGLIVFALVLLRLLWRVFHRPAPLPPGLPRWQLLLSHVTQVFLYGVMLALPITGIIGSSYSRLGLAFFGLPVQLGITPDRPSAKQFFGWHETLVWVLVALVVLHVLGALKHLLLDREQVFGRMWRQRT
jgi:cytochrome b561